MRIGVRAHDFGRHEPGRLAGLVGKSGYQAVQLAMPKAIEGVESLEYVPEEILVGVRDEFAKAGIQIAVLGCYIEPSLLDRKERERQLRIFLTNIEYAKSTGARLVGTETTRCMEGEGTREEMFKNLLDSVFKMVEKAELEDVSVGIEPVASHTLNTPELTYELIRSIASNRLQIIFDPVNLLTPENINDQDRLWYECFRLFGDHISIIHAKDADLVGNAVKELPLGQGRVDYQMLAQGIKLLNREAIILREGALPENADRDINFLNGYFNCDT